MKNTTLTLLSATQIEAFYRAGIWQYDTIYMAAMAHAKARPDAYAVRDRLRRLTYTELLAAADRLAARLHAAGVRPGQRVGVWMPSTVETAIALLACSRNSYTCCPSLHRDHTVADVVALMKRTRATAFIGETGYGADGLRQDIFRMVEGLNSMRLMVRLAPLDSRETDGGLLANTPVAAETTAHSEDPNRVVYLAFTSGTTARPRASCTATTRCCQMRAPFLRTGSLVRSRSSTP
jgi:non-ribosomal peptide synthetase component E (peptide arylation enzyme)